MMRYPLIKPYITDEVKKKVCEVLDSGYLTEGPVTSELEDSFKNYIGCKHAVAATSCTTGLEMALRAVGIGPEDEVIIPDYTYPATADVVAIVGAKIVIVDISKDTMLIDYEKIEKAVTAKTKAIIPVSLFGNPLDYIRLNRIKKKYQLFIIEDAACSIGSGFNGKKVGNYADISVFSLHPRKFITTGEGGIITTDNTEWADWMMSYKHFGMGVQNMRLNTNFDRIGTNYKLSNILAAVGVVQMRNIEPMLEKRKQLSRQYTELISKNSSIKIPETTPKGDHSRQSFCIHIEHRNEVMELMRNEGIEVQIGTYSLNKQPAFSTSGICRIHGNMDASNYAFDHCMVLPLYHDLSYEDQKYIVERLHFYTRQF